MIFSSIPFLFFFLPVVLLLYYSVNTALKNFLLLVASLIFYAWGETFYLLLMLFSICANYLIGMWMEKKRGKGRGCGILLAAGILLNLLPLLFFKYANFIVDNINGVFLSASLTTVELAPVHLPIGISFFTFQAISYIIDVYRQDGSVQRNPADLALYIALFPQLIAGPIVRYRDIARQLSDRRVTLDDFHCGVQRFVFGLAKKILIANNVGAVADHIFDLPSDTLPAGLLWLGMLSYTLQIYYDFSGYSDMAIGLGRMFGFRFLENFRHPYAAVSMQDFWRRWHISLSSWFRDYLYVPLGGNRRGIRRTYCNLLLVFFLCGLWHGASWNFVFWGLYHGLFLVLERSGLGPLLNRVPRFLRHLYTLMAIMVGWVFFRAETMSRAFEYLAGLGQFHLPPYLDAQLFAALNTEFYLALALGIFFSAPIGQFFSRFKSIVEGQGACVKTLFQAAAHLVFLSWMVFVMVYCSAQLVSGTHNPFLYFRF